MTARTPTKKSGVKKSPAKTRRKPAGKNAPVAKSATGRPVKKANAPKVASKSASRAKPSAKEAATKRATKQVTRKHAQGRKTASKTRNPNGRLVAPKVTVLSEEAWSAFWLNVSPVHGATHYEVQIARDHSFTVACDQRVIRKANSRAWFSHLEDGTTYYYRARAWDGDKAGPWSRVGSKELSFYGITKPASNVVATARDKTIEVVWEAATSRTTHPLTYRVVVSSDRAGKNIVAEQSTTACRAVFGSLPNNRRYFFRVHTSNRGERERADTVPKMQRAEAQLVPHRSRARLRVSQPSPLGFTVTWPSRSNTGHWLEVAEDDRFEFAVPYRGYKGSDRLTVNNLEPDTLYWARVVHDDGTDGEPFTVKTAPLNTVLRVGTYNVRYIQLDKPSSEHAWGKRRKAVADVIGPNFDLIGVQEAATWAGGRTFYNRNQIDDLLYLLGKSKHSFARVEADGEQNPGVHILYNPRLLRPTGRAVHVKWVVDGKPRGQATIATLTTLDGTSEVCFGSVHLSPFVTDIERLEHTANLIKHVKAVNTRGAPVIIVGDLNSHEGRTEDTPAVWLTGPNSGLHLVDTEEYEPGRPKSPIHSSNTKWASKVTDFAGFKIDYVLADERIGVKSWNYVETWTPSGRIRKPIASDHHAIVTQLAI